MSDAAFGKVFAGMIGGMITLTVMLIILAFAVVGTASSKKSDVQINAKDQATTARVTPIAGVAVGEVAEQVASAATAEAMSGEDVYQATCAVCHAAGIAGAPKMGDAAMWEPRIAQGMDVMYEHAIKGFNAMPAKGGNMSLGDDSIKAAVDYMTGSESAGQSGESATPPDETVDQAAATTGTGGEVAAAATPAADSDAAAGKSTYDATCGVCHNLGVADAPKLGDATMWQPRLAQGTETLYQHAIGGFNAMPPKGGNVGLSDETIKAAVDYMLNSVN